MCKSFCHLAKWKVRPESPASLEEFCLRISPIFRVPFPCSQWIPLQGSTYTAAFTAVDGDLWWVTPFALKWRLMMTCVLMIWSWFVFFLDGIDSTSVWLNCHVANPPLQLAKFREAPFYTRADLCMLTACMYPQMSFLHIRGWIRIVAGTWHSMYNVLHSLYHVHRLHI